MTTTHPGWEEFGVPTDPETAGRRERRPPAGTSSRLRRGRSVAGARPAVRKAKCAAATVWARSVGGTSARMKCVVDVLNRNRVVVTGRAGAPVVVLAHGFGCDQG